MCLPYATSVFPFQALNKNSVIRSEIPGLRKDSLREAKPPVVGFSVGGSAVDPKGDTNSCEGVGGQHPLTEEEPLQTKVEVSILAVLLKMMPAPHLVYE